MKTNADTKNSQLTSILNHHFKGIVNLARLKLIVHFVIALCKVQTVTCSKLAMLLIPKPAQNLPFIEVWTNRH